MISERPLTVLLVEDSADIREIFGMVLKRKGYAVESASDGQEALKKLQDGLRPSVIVLDLMMPAMNGYEFREAQLQHPELASLPLIVYSGCTDARQNALHLGAAIYLHKPVDAADLIAAVQSLCPIPAETT